MSLADIKSLIADIVEACGNATTVIEFKDNIFSMLKGGTRTERHLETLTIEQATTNQLLSNLLSKISQSVEGRISASGSFQKNNFNAIEHSSNSESNGIHNNDNFKHLTKTPAGYVTSYLKKNDDIIGKINQLESNNKLSDEIRSVTIQLKNRINTILSSKANIQIFQLRNSIKSIFDKTPSLPLDDAGRYPRGVNKDGSLNYDVSEMTQISKSKIAVNLTNSNNNIFFEENNYLQLSGLQFQYIVYKKTNSLINLYLTIDLMLSFLDFYNIKSTDSLLLMTLVDIDEMLELNDT